MHDMSSDKIINHSQLSRQDDHDLGEEGFRDRGLRLLARIIAFHLLRISDEAVEHSSNTGLKQEKGEDEDIPRA